uniref:30S ribosomal protein 3, chloroplastic n=1 Tax=Picea sitchensis TaxID=3332 RepID=A9P110_PICSI|nr:unknown [Picea sitchensis]ABK26613.1 unknown [Picea sitchensis]
MTTTITITSALAVGSLPSTFPSRPLLSPCNIPSTCSCSPLSSACAFRFRPLQAIISNSSAAASGCITPRIGYGSRIQFPQKEKANGKQKQQQYTILKAAQVEARSEPEPEPALEKEEKNKAKVVVKAPRKQRIVLKFIWLEKNIGLALDQVVPGHGTIPLSPYYFWPRKDAWEELKAKLESKSWISQKRTIILLNQATDIINLWQQGGSNI